MASVNRESLRRSFDEQKRTFERLKRDGAMTPESIALIDALMTLLELLIAVFMEKTTTKTGRNSGLPSSRAPQDETAARRCFSVQRLWIMPLTANIFPCMHWRSMKPVFGAASDQTCHRAGQAVSLAKISNIVQSAP